MLSRILNPWFLLRFACMGLLILAAVLIVCQDPQLIGWTQAPH